VTVPGVRNWRKQTGIMIKDSPLVMDYMSSAPETDPKKVQLLENSSDSGRNSTVCRSFATYFSVLACINVK
jgi:hypothetical protein